MTQLLIMLSIELALMMGLISVPSRAMSAGPARATLILSFKEDRPQLIWSFGRSQWVLYQPKESLHQELARTFTEFFLKSNLQTRVYLDGQEEDLFKEGRDPDNEVLVWISHSGKGEGLGESSMIVDGGGHDVLPLFQRSQWNVKNLIVLGCDNDFLTNEWIDHHPETRLQVSGAHLLVRPVSQMLNLLNKIRLKTPTPSIPQDHVSQSSGSERSVSAERDTHQVLIRVIRYRENRDSETGKGEVLPSLRLENFDGQVLTVFPSLLPSESKQELFFSIESSKVNFASQVQDAEVTEVQSLFSQLFNFQLVDSRISEDEPHDKEVIPAGDVNEKQRMASNSFGSRIEFSVLTPLPFQLSWRPFLGKSGHPIGMRRRIFRVHVAPKQNNK